MLIQSDSSNKQNITGTDNSSKPVDSANADLNLSNFNFEAAGQRLGDVVAAMTESPAEAKIDAANGLRGSGGRRPVAEDFDGLFSPESSSGDTVGSEVSDFPFVFGETGSTNVPDKKISLPTALIHSLLPNHER
jgi:hypothetical protein